MRRAALALLLLLTAYAAVAKSSVTVLAWIHGNPIATCPQGTGIADGCTNAPGVSPQSPSLFSGYAARPAWNVPGVDYGVGVQTSCASPTAWQSVSQSGVTVNSGASPPNLTVTGSSVTLNCVDMSSTSTGGGNGAVLIVQSGATNFIGKNLKLGGSNELLTGTAPINIAASGATIEYSVIDGGAIAGTNTGGTFTGSISSGAMTGTPPNCGTCIGYYVYNSTGSTFYGQITAGSGSSWTVSGSPTVSSTTLAVTPPQTALINDTAAGSLTVEYSLLQNANQQFIDTNDSNAGDAITVNRLYNLLQNGGLGVLQHGNTQQQTSGVVTLNLQFNTIVQTSPPGTNAGQFDQGYLNGSGSVPSPVDSYLVMIAKQSGGSNTITYMVDGPGSNLTGTFTMANVFYDISGATAVFYPSSCGSSHSLSSFTNMVSGSTTTPSC